MVGCIGKRVVRAVGLIGLISPFLVACTSSGPAVDVGNASGHGGDRVSVGAALSGSGGTVVAASDEIVYDSTQVNVALNADNTPRCTIDARIGAGSAADKTLLLSVTGAGATQKKLTVGVINLQNATVISDGALFACDFVIAPGARAGATVLQHTLGASDAQGNEIPVTGTTGTITVG